MHRDVKPGNILIARQAGASTSTSPTSASPSAASAGRPTSTGEFLGTVEYVAPEQIEGQPVDGRADVYSLGCVLYECLAGEPPFRSDSKVAAALRSPAEAAPSVSSTGPSSGTSIDTVIARAMAKQPDERYASCGELAKAAAAALAEVRGRASRLPSTGRRPRWSAARRSWPGCARPGAMRAAGSGALLVLSGPRGIGKTRLAAELARGGDVARAPSCATPAASDPTARPRSLAGAVSATRPTLLVLEDLDAAEAPCSRRSTRLPARSTASRYSCSARSARGAPRPRSSGSSGASPPGTGSASLRR